MIGNVAHATMEGMLLVHKPSGPTSHDVVALVRQKLGVRRIGHTGTLDPLAEGLLILLVGAATKSQRAFQGHDKTYEAVLRLGRQTQTGDALGKTSRTAPVPAVEPARVAEVLDAFRGILAQTPPAYSAVKIQGRPAYWWARRGAPVSLKAREIEVRELSLLGCGPETVTFRMHCSAGTYVRSLAESIAERLGTVGHLERLVRLRIGAWSLDDAKPLEWIRSASPESIARELRPLPPQTP